VTVGRRSETGQKRPVRALDPLRAVTLIEERTGARGGGAWLLTLECGHVAVRAKREPKPWNILATPLARFLAPTSVRCWMCAAEERGRVRRLVESEVAELRALAARLAEPWPVEAAAWEAYRSALPDRHTGMVEHLAARMFPHSYRPARCHCHFCEGTMSGWEAVAISRGWMDP
jgi:hypothetical protein